MRTSRCQEKPKLSLRLSFAILTVSLGILGCASTSTQHALKKDSTEELSRLHVQMGTQALLRGEYSLAIKDLRKAININEDSPTAHNHLGLAYFGLGKKDLAVKEIKKATEIDPMYSDAWINLGNFANQAGNKKKAKEYYLKALDNLEYKYRHRALTNLAQVYLLEHNNAKAKELLYQSLHVNSNYCLTHFLLGTAFTREGNSERAAEAFKSSVAKTCVSNPEGHYQLGLAYLKSKQYDKARHAFVYLIQEFPQTNQAEKAGDQLRNIP